LKDRQQQREIGTRNKKLETGNWNKKLVLALFSWLLSIMAGAHRGFGSAGRKSAFPLVIF